MLSTGDMGNIVGKTSQACAWSRCYIISAFIIETSYFSPELWSSGTSSARRRVLGVFHGFLNPVADKSLVF